jgi:hypothetical protein
LIPSRTTPDGVPPLDGASHTLGQGAAVWRRLAHSRTGCRRLAPPRTPQDLGQPFDAASHTLGQGAATRRSLTPPRQGALGTSSTLEGASGFAKRSAVSAHRCGDSLSLLHSGPPLRQDSSWQPLRLAVAGVAAALQGPSWGEWYLLMAPSFVSDMLPGALAALAEGGSVLSTFGRLPALLRPPAAFASSHEGPWNLLPATEADECCSLQQWQTDRERRPHPRPPLTGQGVRPRPQL